MTGTGTSTDPYIVDNWNDLVSKMKEYDVYIELDPNSENKVIDMNDAAPNGVGNISIKFRKLKGNGWTIKNIYCPYKNLFTYNSVSSQETKHSITFENLNIVNIYKNDTCSEYDCSVFYSNNREYPLIFRNCKISCVIASNSSSSYPTLFSDYVNFYNCSINLKVYSQYFIPFEGWNQYGMCSMQNCNIIINAQNITKIWSYFTVSNTKIGGIVNKTLYNFINDDYTKFNTLVLDLIADYTGTIADNVCGLINSDKAPNITAGTGMNLVTTEQMTNAEYLTSIGFPIFTEG
ncbi:MAG: hypothetical protein SPE43_09895 [Ruminococcus sp.]|nr:hypothetical protein [Ruminococcus sp.]